MLFHSLFFHPLPYPTLPASAALPCRTWLFRCLPGQEAERRALPYLASPLPARPGGGAPGAAVPGFSAAPRPGGGAPCPAVPGFSAAPGQQAERRALPGTA